MLFRSGDPGADGFRAARVTTGVEADLGEALLAALLAQGLRVRALGREQPTLEDVFLAATRRSWDVVSPRPAPAAS